MQPSIQRTMFVAGPNRIYRELFDGQVFTDCNYWKAFDIAVHPDTGFIEVLFDDGSVFSDIPSENTFPKVFSPYNVLSTDTFATNFIKEHPDKLEYLRELLGHKDMQMIRKHYGHLFDEHSAIHGVLDSLDLPDERSAPDASVRDGPLT